MKLFLSYTSADRDWAHWIGVTLRDAGHEMFVHEWEVAAGENIPAWMERKLEEADKMVGVFSPAYVEAVHSNAERWAAYWQDPDGRDGFLVPIEVVKLARWPAFAANKKRLSLIGLDEVEAARRLIEFLEPPRAPTTRPRFPGGSGGGGAPQPSTGVLNLRLPGATLSAEGTPPPFDAGSAALPPTTPRFPSERDEAAGGSEKSPIPKTRGPTFTGHSMARGNPSPIIRSREDLARWLEGEPREFGRVLAVRAALRVAPLLVGLEVRRYSYFKGPSALLLPLLRGIASPWASAKYPARGAEARLAFAAAADAAADAADDAGAADDAAGAAAAAAFAAAAAAFAADTFAAAAAFAADAFAAFAAFATDAAFAARAASWEAVTIDVSLLVGSADAVALAGAKLWPNGVPVAIAQAHVDFSNQLLSRRDEGWRHWLEWLNDRFSDDPVRRAGDEEKDIARLTLPEEMWKEGARTIAGVKAVNAEIARRFAEIDERRARAEIPPSSSGGEADDAEPHSVEPPSSDLHSRTSTDKPLLFVSYAHKDRVWLDELKSHLGPHLRAGALGLWDDTQLFAGDVWADEIEEAMRGCRVCVLLVSRHSLTSDYIDRVEMPAVLERVKRDGVAIVPIFVSPVSIPDGHWLRKFNWRPADGRTLLEFSPDTGARDAELVKIAGEIVALLDRSKSASKQVGESRSKETGPTSPPMPTPRLGSTFDVGSEGLERDPGPRPKSRDSVVVRQHDRLRLGAEELAQDVRRYENRFPRLTRVVARYATAIAPDFGDLDLFDLHDIGLSLVELATMFKQAHKNGKDGPEPEDLAELSAIATRHLAFGHRLEEMREYGRGAETDRNAERVSDDIIGPMQRILAALSRLTEGLAPETKAYFEAMADGLGETDASHPEGVRTVYAALSNALIAIALHYEDVREAKLAKGAAASRLSTRPADTRALLGFLTDNERDVIAFSKPFSKLELLLEWVFGQIGSKS